MSFISKQFSQPIHHCFFVRHKRVNISVKGDRRCLNGRVLCQDELTLCVSISGLSCTLPTCLLVHRHHTTLTCCALVFIYLIVASGVFGLSCSVQTLGRGMWGLVPRPWIEPGTPASGGCLSCRATRAVPILSFKS